MNHTIELPGLIGSTPLGAMAAFGLIRVLSQNGVPARLRWKEADDWVAVVESELRDSQSLIRWLGEWIKTRPTSDLSWTEGDVRVEPRVYRAALAKAVDSDPHLASFLAALAADGAVDKSKGLIKPCAFYMASGRMSFLGNLRQVLGAIREAAEERWTEALLGPWAYGTALHSLGWDPAGERVYALRSRAPTSEKARCVAGAVWLAYEALPYFPALSRDGREETAGFYRSNDRRTWRWPLTSVGVGAEPLRLLLQRHWGETDSLPGGVCAVYESERFEFGQGYAIFRPARRVA